MRRSLAFVVASALACLPVMASEIHPVQATRPFENWRIDDHPDIREKRSIPTWTRPENTSLIWWHLKLKMNLARREDAPLSPFVRLWKNIPQEDRMVCSGCDPTKDYYIESRNEIWVSDQHDVTAMVELMLQRLQVSRRGINPDDLDAPFARNERRFFLELFQKYPPHPYP